MSYYLDRNVLLMSYCVASNCDPPTESQLQRWHADVWSTYGTEVDRQATRYGIPRSAFDDSMVIFFALQAASELRLIQDQVVAACDFYRHVRPQLTAFADSSAGTAAVGPMRVLGTQRSDATASTHDPLARRAMRVPVGSDIEEDDKPTPKVSTENGEALRSWIEVSE